MKPPPVEVGDIFLDISSRPIICFYREYVDYSWKSYFIDEHYKKQINAYVWVTYARIGDTNFRKMSS